MEKKKIDKFDLITCRPLAGWNIKNEGGVAYSPLELKYLVVNNLWKELADDGVMLVHFSTYKEDDLKRLSDWTQKLNESGAKATFLEDRGGIMMISKKSEGQDKLEKI